MNANAASAAVIVTYASRTISMERRLYIRIELTDSAKARAEAAGLDVNTATQVLDAGVQTGDRMSFGGDPSDDFVVLRRRYLIGSGPVILVLELDYPARN